MERPNAWKTYKKADLKKVEQTAAEYRRFLDNGKTERECAAETVEMLEKAGYVSLKSAIEAGKKLKPGDKVYVNQMGKAVLIFLIGKKPLETGMNIVGAHIDSPRLDLKQNPLYEDNDFALADTHYYGGVKKYQWVARELALHGVVAKKDGSIIEIRIGEKEDDPVVGVTDLLIHLSQEQMKKTLGEAISGEKLDISDELNPDHSVIEWYRGASPDGSDAKIVATTTYADDGAAPLKAYRLTGKDVGYYLTCVVRPRYAHSEEGESLRITAGEPVKAEDVADDPACKEFILSNLAYTTVENGGQETDWAWDTSGFESGFWYGGFYLPAEYREGGVYAAKRFSPAAGETPFTYAQWTNGAKGTVGLQTTTQGARLVYCDGEPRGDMTLTVTLSPHKNAGQGFGSGNQFLDIYFKYDARTMTGYGLRITREAETEDEKFKDYLGKSCSFVLMEYREGTAVPVSEKVFATAFNPTATVVIAMEGNVLTARVTTTMAQSDSYPDYMPNEVFLTHTFEAANQFGGIGFQHTGTAGEGKAGNRTTIHTIKIEYR